MPDPEYVSASTAPGGRSGHKPGIRLRERMGLLLSAAAFLFLLGFAALREPSGRSAKGATKTSLWMRIPLPSAFLPSTCSLVSHACCPRSTHSKLSVSTNGGADGALVRAGSLGGEGDAIGCLELDLERSYTPLSATWSWTNVPSLLLKLLTGQQVVEVPVDQLQNPVSPPHALPAGLQLSRLTSFAGFAISA